MIRPVERRDVPAIVRLHVEVFGHPDPGLERFSDLGYERLLFDHPWRRDDPAGLVVEREGRIVGSVAILPQRMRLDGEDLRVLVPTKFIVESGVARGLVAAQLVRALVDQPHDLLLSDNGTDAMLPLWQRAGGFVLTVRSLSWTRTFRPGESWRQRLLRRRGGERVIARFGVPVARLVDLGLARGGWNHFSVEPSLAVEEVDSFGRLYPLMESVAETRPLRPVFDHDVLDWQLAALRGMQGPARTLRALIVRTHGGHDVGWALYYAWPGGVSEVLQLHCLKAELAVPFLRAVLERMSLEGALAVRGPVDESVLRALGSERCTLTVGRPWYLAETPHRELQTLLRSGDFMHSRLEGEWW